MLASVFVCCRLPTSFYIPTGYKGCCVSNVSENIQLTMDVVNGVKKPVLALNAYNRDNNCLADSPTACSKVVDSAGGLITADIYASGSFSVVAKASGAPGLIFAM